MTTDLVKTERCLPMAVDDSTNDASGTSFISVGGGTGSGFVGGNVAGTPRDSAKSQNIRRTLVKPAFEKDKHSFLCDLQMFHDKHGTPYLKLPKISGKDVDLHKLYSIVISRGGWMKVNAREDWDEVIEELDLPTRCVNNEIALKQIYIRYLDRYERVNFHGEDKDPAEDEDDEKRLHRRWSVRMLHSTPTVYNHHQHNVPEGLRTSLKLSDDLYQASEYDKLILSLLSPLPNEQDFAINVCTLMSNEPNHLLKVDKCPRLVYALLAHAGVFNHFSLRDTFDEYYSNIRKNSLQRFWKDCLFEKPQVLELSLEDCFAKMGTDPSALIASIYQDDQEEAPCNDSAAGDKADEENGGIWNGKLNTATLRSFLCLGTGLGANDYIGQRVLQVAAIFRNLSFNDENLLVLGHNRTFIRFLIMCANARWNNLHHLGLDMLGNIANDIDINDPQSDEVTRCLVSTLSEGLEGADRGVIISCLEVLSKIAQKETNEENLNRCLNQKVYDQMCLFLCLSDIMLLLYTLECIYSLTSMGEKPCSSIMHIAGVIDTLVSLVTVEAQSYGTEACILMRVVETPGSMAAHQSAYYPAAVGLVPSNAPPTMTQLTVHKENHPHIPTPPDVPKLPSLVVSNKPMPSPPVLQQVQQVQQQKLQQQQPSHHVVQTTPQPTPTGHGVTNNNNNQIVTVTRPPAADSPQIPVNVIARADPTMVVTHGATPNQQTASPSTHAAGGGQLSSTSGTITVQNSTLGPSASITAKHIQQQQAQESEQFAYAWLRASFEAAPAVRIEQQELYKLYLATSGKLGRKVILPQAHFPRCVRAVFGGTVGPVQLKIEQNGVETVGYYYEGLRMRLKPLPIVHKGTVLTPTVEYSPAGAISLPHAPAKQEEQTTGRIIANVNATTTEAGLSMEMDVLQQGNASSTKANSNTTITLPTVAPVGRTVVPAGQEPRPMAPVNQQSPLRSSTVIAMAPPSSSSGSVGKQPAQAVSVVQKSVTYQQSAQPKGTLQFQQPFVPSSAGSAPSTNATGGGAPTSMGKQIIVTQVGGKNVVINKAPSGQQHQYIPSTPSSPLLQQVLSSDQKNVIVVNQTTISPQPVGSVPAPAGHSALLQTGTGTTTIMNQSGTISSTTTNPSALIKSLLANKVTTTVTDSTVSAATAGASAVAAAAAPYSSSLSTTTITNSPTTNCLIAPNVNVHQVAQRQQMQKQKQMIEQKMLPGQSASGIHPSVVVTSNNPNNLTNIKVGNSTISIKPGTLPTNTVITATNPHETATFNAPPPLAPLSQPGSQGGAIIKTIPADQGKLIPNKVLSELLEKKPGEMLIAGETTIKRKFDGGADPKVEPPIKRVEGGAKTADLYAELAGSITEGEDVEEVQDVDRMKMQQIAFQQQQQQQLQQQQQQQQQQQMITMPMSMQRQIIVTPNSAQPMIISTPTGNAVGGPAPQHLSSQATATIKTDTGYQTVPIILQHNAIGAGGGLQLQKASTPGGAIVQSAVLSSPHQPPPTQYILATNPQGQTYVVAQQAQPPPQLQQTVLLTQGQQHGGPGQKTIIIVQQQPQPQAPTGSAPGATQKIYLNQQGQQILMTQLPRQMIVSHSGQSSPSGATIITTSAPSSMPGAPGTIIEKKPIYITTNAQGNTISFEAPPQQLQMQAIPAGGPSGSFQIKPQHVITQQPGGSQAIQFIQQPGGGVLTSGPIQHPSTTQSIQPTSQIVFQTHGGAGGASGQAQIIQQQIIQPAVSQQPQQHIVQKVLQHQQPQPHLIQTGGKPSSPQLMAVQQQQQQQQKQPVVTISQSQPQLPPTLSIQRQTGALSQSIVPAKPVPVPNVGPTVVSSVPAAPQGLLGGKQQIIQVVQQKITAPVGRQPGGGTVAAPPGAPGMQVQPTVTQTVVQNPPPVAMPASPAAVNPGAASSPGVPPSNVGQTPAPSHGTSSGVSATSTGAPSAPAPITSTITIPVSVTTGGGANGTGIQMIPAMDPAKIVEEDVEPSWPWICDWRGCPRKRFQSATEVFRHACTVHCPDTVDVTADIFCQWGPGPNLCDNLPRKRFSLMTHILDRHCTAESFKSAVQRRLTSGPQQSTQPYPVTLVRQSGAGNGNASVPNGPSSGGSHGAGPGERGSPAPASCTKVESGGTEAGGNGPGQFSSAGSAALLAMKRNSMDYGNSKEFQDEVEGPVTKSIRLTSALILRNLVVYTNSAKRSLRRYEAHLAGVALSNVESSRTVAQLLFEMNDTGPNY